MTNPLTQGAELISHDVVSKKPSSSKAENFTPSKEVQRKNDLDQLQQFERGVARRASVQSSSNRMREFLCYQDVDRSAKRSASVEPKSNQRPAGRPSDLDFIERAPARSMRRLPNSDYAASAFDSSCDTPRR